MYITYIDKRFQSFAETIIQKAEEIIHEYGEQGYDLTLRQLYYQFVARGYLPNQDREYHRLSKIISNARLAGRLSWNSIVDRLRMKQGHSHWEDPSEILEVCARQFRIDTRATQKKYIEVWVEKDALSDVVARACNELDVPYLVCRGFVSQSAMWQAAQRLNTYEDVGKQTVIFHLGDHDPSGIDMTRDIQERLELFYSSVYVHRIGLNMDQIQQYKPPPNPVKLTDSRKDAYVEKYGVESWELDALDPVVIHDLIVSHVMAVTDEKKLKLLVRKQNAHRKKLMRVAREWDKI